MLSVVICTRDRPERLMQCARSVTAQTFRPIELIVVDDGELSEDVQRAVGGLCAPAGIPFTYLRKTEPGLPASRNLAVRHAHGDIVQFLDDDVTLAPTFCKEVVALYAADPGGALLGVDGTLVEVGDESLGARYFKWMYRLAGWWALRPRDGRRPPMPAVLRDRRRASPSQRIIGATMSFRRSALLAEPFDQGLTGYALGEDRDIAYRLGRRGWIARCHTAHAVHHLDPVGRPGRFAFGEMVVRNYVRIMLRNGFCGVGERLVMTYSVLVVALSMLLASVVNPQRYLREFLGVLWGSRALVGLIQPNLGRD